MSTPRTRFAISLLSITNKDRAINDELMIDKTTGRMYYKKPNGSIVPCGGGSSNDESSNTVDAIAATGISRADIHVGSNTTDSLYVVTDTQLEEQSIFTAVVPDDVSITLDKDSRYFFIQVSTRDQDKLYTSLLSTIRDNDSNVDASDKGDIEIEFTLQLIHEGQIQDTITGMTKKVYLNKMNAVQFATTASDIDHYQLTITNMTNLLSDYYDPTTQAALHLYSDIIPDDTDIKYSMITIAYFTPSTDTVFIDDNTSVRTIGDAKGILEKVGNRNPMGYINSVIYPLIASLYNAGLSTRKKYVRTFTASDWTLNVCTNRYQIVIPEATHSLSGEIVASVMVNRDGIYLTSNGVWESVDYQIEYNGSVITLSTEEAFAGKLVCTDSSSFTGSLQNPGASQPTTYISDLTFNDAAGTFAVTYTDEYGGQATNNFTVTESDGRVTSITNETAGETISVSYTA